MDQSLITGDLMHQAGQAANHAAQHAAFGDYLDRKANNTIRRHASDLDRFVAYLNAVHPALGAALADFAHAVRDYPTTDEPPNAAAWHGVTWGMIEGFRNWMLREGDAITAVNARLSAIKTYAGIATKAGILTDTEIAMIRMVKGYSQKETKRINAGRDTTRRGQKKAQAVIIDDDHAQHLKTQPDTPQGRRDALVMCLLLDHGLRVGEVAKLQVTDFDLKAGELRFYRPKVDKTQTHKLTADTLRAARAWFDSGDAPPVGPVLRGSRNGGDLTGAGMTDRAITDRVRTLGQRLGIEGLSAHDCRHYWATYWSKRVDPFQLKEAGGWSSMATVDRYVEAGRIANEGMA